MNNFVNDLLDNRVWFGVLELVFLFRKVNERSWKLLKLSRRLPNRLLLPAFLWSFYGFVVVRDGR